MKIKKIEIQGFKSFVDKTTFIFPKGVSAIVGPNGCGKSNIVDAIRWVLGEQNARHLRGKLMEDVIFAGSERIKSVGMAEVILTLSNEEGLAPQEYANFTEIEIVRRLFRSGDSEYYINKVQSRLKDIVDLFTDTGIGTRAYSIIEQGQVGWLVTAKPEERRTLFEEAAGINKYKHRKDAALRRLEATRGNLTRVSDIISEVKRQLNSLNRQAKKAERFKVLRDELKEIELFIASEEYAQLKDRLADREKNLKELKGREIELAAKMDSVHGMLEDLKIESLNKETSLKEVRSLAADVENSIQLKERDIELNRMGLLESKRNKERLLEEIEELDLQGKRTSCEIEELKKAIEDISSTIKRDEERLAVEEKNLSSVSEKLSEKETELKNKRTSLADVMARIAQNKNSMHIYLRDEDAVNLKVGRLERERNEIENIISSKEISINKIKDGIAKIADRRQDIERGERAADEKVKDIEKRLIEIDAEQKTRKQELASAVSRLKTLMELERNLEGFRDGIKAIIQTKMDKGIRGIVADIIEAQPEYERAVEVVLGERLQYIIVDNQDDGVSLVEYLKTNGLGRGSFIPVWSKRGKAEGMKDDSRDFLLNYVAAKDGYSSVVNCLLGDVLVANSFKDAVEMWNKNRMDKTVVTLEGDIIDAYGIITGGKTNGSESGILQKKREIKELSGMVLIMEQRISEFDNEMDGLKGEIGDSKKRLEELKSSGLEKDKELINLEADLKGDVSELNRLKERQDVIGFEMDESKRQISEINQKKTEFTRERESLEAGLREIETETARIEADALGLVNEKESMLNLITELKVNLASARERLEGMKIKEEEKARFIEGVAERVHAKKVQVEEGAKEMDEREMEAKRMQGEVEELLRKRDDVKKGEVIKEEALNEALKRIQEIQDGVRLLQDEMNSVHENINDLNLEIKELELKSMHLVERIREKYNVKIDAYTPTEGIRAMETGDVSKKYDELKSQIDLLGEVSLSALEEYRELEGRHEFLLNQQADLNNSIETLQKAVNRINRTTRQRFKETFDAINTKFQDVFPVFFPGGRAELRLIDEGDILESGIEIAAQPAGKRLQGISLLSGGEKAMTATALIFSIFLIKPSPFCLLDEVDAPLDDANIGRFNSFLKEMAKKSQFVLITHNKGTMEIADSLFGITMEEPGISKVVSVRLN